MTSDGAPASDDARALTVLVVDDERRNRQLLEVMLLPEGYVVQLATNGEEALQMAFARPPAIVLLDVMMPGVDGYQVAARLRAHDATKNVPIIILTALDDHNSSTHGLRSGAVRVMTKPVNRADLCEAVRQLIAESSSAA